MLSVSQMFTHQICTKIIYFLKNTEIGKGTCKHRKKVGGKISE